MTIKRFFSKWRRSAILDFGNSNFLTVWVVKRPILHNRAKPRGRPKKTWKDVVREDCQARKLNKDDAMDRCKWRKVIKEAR